MVELVTAEGISEKDLIRLAGALEQSSTHPLAQAVVAATHGYGIHSLPEAVDAENVPGYGTKGLADGRRVLVGNLDLLRREGVDTDLIEGEATRVASAGRSVVAVAVDGAAAGVIALADVVRSSAAATVRAFRDQGIEVSLLTGDNEGTGRAVAAAVGIDRVFANVKPADKANYVRQLQAEGKVVAMVGDGVNDAPALAAADVGIAIGAGTDVAIETAAVVLMRSDPVDVLKAIDLSKATMRKMKQNLFWASIYNVSAIPLAAGVLVSSTGFQIRPEIAALLMSVSSIIVATNAVLLRRQGRHMAEIERSVGTTLAAAPALSPGS